MDLIPIWKQELNAFCLSSIITSSRRKSGDIPGPKSDWKSAKSSPVNYNILPRQQYFSFMDQTGEIWVID